MTILYGGGTVWPVSGTYSCITKVLHYIATNPNPDSCVQWANHVTFDYTVSDMDLTGSFSNDCGYGKGFTAVAVMGKCLQLQAPALKQDESGSTGSHLSKRSFIQLPKGINLQDLLSNKPMTIKITPNPAPVFANIEFELPENSKLHAGIYDLQGNLIRILKEGTIMKGNYYLQWDLKSMRGERVEKGIYWLKIITDKDVISRQILVER